MFRPTKKIRVRKSHIPKASPLVLGAIALSASGLIVGSLLAPQPTPSSGLGATGSPSITIHPSVFDDARTVKLKVAVSEKTALTVSASGVVTAIDCHPGQNWAAGNSSLSINEAPKLTVFAENPLWRDLSGGEKGADVTAIQRVLADAGFVSPSTGEFDSSTRAAWQRLLQANDISSPYGAFLLSDLIMLPAEEVTLGACPARRGDKVAAGASIAELQSALVSVAMDSSPLALTPGPRTLTIGGSTVPVGENAAVTEPAALAQLTSEPAIIAKVETPVVELSGVYRLATPLTVYRVPPSVLLEVEDTTACIIGADEKGYPVTIVSSSLGSTAVTFASEVTPPDKAILDPEASISCD